MPAEFGKNFRAIVNPFLPAALLCIFPLFTAQAVESKKVDSRPAAQAATCTNEDIGMYKHIQEKDFEELAREFDPRAFRRWQRKLARVRLGMGKDEVEKTLAPKKMDCMVTFGSGITIDIELDEAYSVRTLFSYDGKLIAISDHPIAITYWVLKKGEIPFRASSLPQGGTTLPK